MDNAEDLLCFENGLYDLSKGVFKKGVLEDRVSISTGYYYVAEGKGCRGEVAEHFCWVYPEDDIRGYMLRIYVQLLNGRLLKRIFIHTGGFHLAHL